MTIMIATLAFSLMAASLVLLAGRKDAARDPFLTGVLLVLLAVFPLLSGLSPKLHVLPAESVSPIEAGLSGQYFLPGIWLAGFVVLMLRLIGNLIALAGWRRRSSLLDRVKNIEIRELRGIKGPVAAGVIRRVVFVPEAWNSWSAGNRKIALDHELAHHQRRDPMWRLLAEIACVVHWFNPLVWWMAHRLAIQCEFACDAAVLRNGVKPADYATLLCDLAEDAGPGGCAMAMAARPTLEIRVRRLMESRKNHGMAGVSLLVVLAIVCASLFASIGSKSVAGGSVSPEEIRTRWSADPFPGESGLR